jgi:hypothetical protein
LVVYSDTTEKWLESVLIQNDKVITYASHQLKDYE